MELERSESIDTDDTGVSQSKMDGHIGKSNYLLQLFFVALI